MPLNTKKKSIVTFQETVNYLLNNHSGDVLLNKNGKNVDLKKQKEDFVRIKIADAGAEEISPFNTEYYEVGLSILNSLKLREKYIFKEHCNCNIYFDQILNCVI